MTPRTVHPVIFPGDKAHLTPTLEKDFRAQRVVDVAPEPTTTEAPEPTMDSAAAEGFALLATAFVPQVSSPKLPPA